MLCWGPLTLHPSGSSIPVAHKHLSTTFKKKKKKVSWTLANTRRGEGQRALYLDSRAHKSSIPSREGEKGKEKTLLYLGRSLACAAGLSQDKHKRLDHIKFKGHCLLGWAQSLADMLSFQIKNDACEQVKAP